MIRRDKNKTKIFSSNGGALIIVMAIMLLLTIAAVTAVDIANTDIELSFNQLHLGQAFYVAEAGLTRAYAQLVEDRDWREGYSAILFERGSYDVIVIDSIDYPTLADTVLLKATGNVENSLVNLEAVLVPDYRRPFQYAMFAADGLTLDNNTCTDSYNSDSGSYRATVRQTNADVGSNGPIAMTNSSQVGGNATSSVENGITMVQMATVLGDTATGEDPMSFDIVDENQFRWASENSMAPYGFQGNGYVYNPGDQSLEVRQNQTMTLSGGVYYFTDVTVGSNSHIEIAPGEKAVIYMSGNLSLSQYSSVNADGKASNLQIYSQGDALKMENNTELKAAFYGPNTDVVIDNNTGFFGSVMARTVQMRNNSCFHYDRSLANLITGETGDLKMIAWKEL